MTTHWRSLHIVNNYRVSHPNELLSASSDHHAEQRTSHIDHKQRVSLLYEPLNVVWGNLTDWRILRTMSNYMVFHPNEFLSASSDDQATQRISHTDHKERVSHQYEFSNGEQEQLTDWMTWNNEDICFFLYKHLARHLTNLKEDWEIAKLTIKRRIWKWI